MNQNSWKILVTTVPFGEADPAPLDLLKAAGVSFDLNPFGRRFQEDELAERIGPYHGLIAGTEPITRRVMEQAPNLKHISRVGIGLDSVDLIAARELGIQVSYTPDAPAPAVAELAVGQMLNLLRLIPQADRGMRRGIWKRLMGRRLSECVVGIIGLGRIGKRVTRHLSGFGPKILVNDITPDLEFIEKHSLIEAAKEQIYVEADIITLHVPLTRETRGLIGPRELAMMKPDALLINTARGGIVDEAALAAALRAGKLGGAAIDVFEQEPYSGELTGIENCLLTCHMGSCSVDCRARMEREATEEALRFVRNEPLRGLVPESEYLARGVRS
ncbi:MAG: phosphoglycerate dehydrogenase [Candidatus Omnitrophica bacterium]|nr:phosphoglycerate dehydrogenase [Candidatus Omnitrophota bacterium]